MMNARILHQLVVVSMMMVIGFIASNMSLAIASEKNLEREQSNTALPDQSPYFWYDGDQKRHVWVNPKLVAEFNPKTEMSTQLMTFYEAKNLPTQSSSYVQFWELDSKEMKISVLERSMEQANGQLSPVLHDSASTSGTKKALPGNVLVQMKPEWSQYQMNAWFKEHRLVVIKPLVFAPNTFLIQTGPGLESLNTANRIYETGDVILASPNWWQDVYSQ